jgi:hypothetical protein
MRHAPAVGEYIYVGRTIGIVERARGYDALQRCALVRFVNGTAQYIDWEQLISAPDGYEAWRRASDAERS